MVRLSFYSTWIFRWLNIKLLQILNLWLASELCVLTMTILAKFRHIKRMPNHFVFNAVIFEALTAHCWAKGYKTDMCVIYFCISRYHCLPTVIKILGDIYSYSAYKIR